MTRDSQTSIIHYISRFCPVLLCTLFLASCNAPTVQNDLDHAVKKTKDGVNNLIEHSQDGSGPIIDPNIGLTAQDYKDEYFGQAPLLVQDTPAEPMLPDVSSLLLEPRPPVVANDKLVTISVTEDVPLKDVVMELARRADVDVEIDPGIQGGIIFRAKDKPFSEVIERIAELAGLRYSIKNGVMRVERDTPFIVNYNVSILNQVRAATGNVNVSTQVLSTSVGGGGGSSALNTGSTSQIDYTRAGERSIWTEIEDTIAVIIERYSGRSTNLALASPAAGGFDASGNPISTAPGSSDIEASGTISINPQSGVVAVHANQRQHLAIKNYLDDVIKSNTSQVLIEAKILEVTLDDQYRAGIDWNAIGSDKINADLTSSLIDASGTDDVDSLLNIGIIDTDVLGGLEIDALVSLTERFGVTRTLSNPRVNATNNQPAVLTFARNEVYFELDIQEEETGLGESSVSNFNVDSTIKTVPIGVILTLQPSINLDTNEITMSIRPTLSRITGTVADPAVAITTRPTEDNPDQEQITSSVPIIEVREIDSVLRVKSGQVMVIGGLMEERTDNEDTGVPFLQDVPVMGNLFKSVKRTTTTVETVIFIKATIVPGHGVAHEDKAFYHKFSADRRPLAF